MFYSFFMFCIIHAFPSRNAVDRTWYRTPSFSCSKPQHLGSPRAKVKVRYSNHKSRWGSTQVEYLTGSGGVEDNRGLEFFWIFHGVLAPGRAERNAMTLNGSEIGVGKVTEDALFFHSSPHINFFFLSAVVPECAFPETVGDSILNFNGVLVAAGIHSVEFVCCLVLCYCFVCQSFHFYDGSQFGSQNVKRKRTRRGQSWKRKYSPTDGIASDLRFLVGRIHARLATTVKQRRRFAEAICRP